MNYGYCFKKRGSTNKGRGIGRTSRTVSIVFSVHVSIPVSCDGFWPHFSAKDTEIERYILKIWDNFG